MNEVPVQTTDPVLVRYYSNRRLMWRNVFFIIVGNFGHSVCFTLVAPLMILRMNSSGVGEGGIGTLNSVNSWAVSFLVMYFSWKSDHLVSRWGRRIPFLFISAPFIILTVLLFPLFSGKWVLIGLMLVHMFFMDMKASTFPLLSIDCVPRNILARINSLVNILQSITGFLALRYGMQLAEKSNFLPYALGAGILTMTTLLAGYFIKEPPICSPTIETFKPWSAIRVGWRDPRSIVLMLAVAMIQGFMIMYGTWLWLFAKNSLGLSRADSASAISWSLLIPMVLAYPVGYIVDRWGSYKVVVVYWVMQVITFFTVIHVSGPSGLIVVSLLATCTGSFFSAADILIYKSAPPAEVGSVTSTNAFLRNAFVGCFVILSGFLIQATGGRYTIVYGMGIMVSTIGLVLILVYRRMMQQNWKPFFLKKVGAIRNWHVWKRAANRSPVQVINEG
ncbi:MAG: MFS transporter [Phycisphaerae bacterium]